MSEVVQPSSRIITDLIQTKLAAINTMLRNNQFTTRDDQTQGILLSAVQIAITDYLKAIQSSDSSVSTNLVKRGNINSSALYNTFWNSVNNDLDVLYAEANNVGEVLTDHYNYVNADIQNMLIQLKVATSNIENYALLTSSPVTGQQTFIEKFTNTAMIDVNSPLLGDTQCNIDTIGGIITLAIAASTTIQSTAVNSIVIGSANSNGSIYGTTQLLDVIDSSNFQLFQYQLTSETPTTNTLTLDFTINIKTPTILNFIRIVPNNFGTQTWPTITSLDISSDGINFTSLRDILLSVDNDPTQFVLAPYTSNFAGEGRYSFIPQSTKFVHFTIQQTTPYFNTNTGLYTWAIGIKDIELTGNQFSPTSQVISLPYNFAAGVSKISINADELPPLAYDSGGNIISLATVLHDISIDGGMTWHQITPEYVSLNVPTMAPQIINVNNIDSQLKPNDPSSINTTQLATSVRYRLRLSTNSPALNNNSLLPYASPIVKQLVLKVVTQGVI